MAQQSTVDTDVVVLAVTSAQHFDISELWVAFGAGKSFRFLAAHEIARALGPDWCRLADVLTPSLGVTWCPLLEAEARGLHGTHGTNMEMSTQFSVPWLLVQARNP